MDKKINEMIDYVCSIPPDRWDINPKEHLYSIIIKGVKIVVNVNHQTIPSVTINGVWMNREREDRRLLELSYKIDEYSQTQAQQKREAEIDKVYKEFIELRGY